jgi:hypothetical protein
MNTLKPHCSVYHIYLLLGQGKSRDALTFVDNAAGRFNQNLLRDSSFTRTSDTTINPTEKYSLYKKKSSLYAKLNSFPREKLFAEELFNSYLTCFLKCNKVYEAILVWKKIYCLNLELGQGAYLYLKRSFKSIINAYNTPSIIKRSNNINFTKTLNSTLFTDYTPNTDLVTLINKELDELRFMSLQGFNNSTTFINRLYLFNFLVEINYILKDFESCRKLFEEVSQDPFTTAIGSTDNNTTNSETASDGSYFFF